MNCPHCESSNTRQCNSKTNLGYTEYRCRNCCRQYNERTGTVFNNLEYPTEVVILAVRYYFEFKTSLDDVVKLMAMRGFMLSHQTVWNWCQSVGLELALQFRAHRKGKAGKKWHADATYIRIEGCWCYFYRCIDKEGNLVDVYLSDTRDDAAAEAFFKQCHNTTSVMPEQVTVDKERALRNGIETNFGDNTKVRDSKYMNNRIEQDHRGVKGWYQNMRGFKNFFNALISLTVFEEIRQHFKMQGKTRGERRGLLVSLFQEFDQMILDIV